MRSNNTLGNESGFSIKMSGVFLILTLFMSSVSIYEMDCWGQPYRDAALSAHAEAELSVPLSVVQECLLPGGRLVWGSPVASGDNLVIACSKPVSGFGAELTSADEIYCFSMHSGECKWTFKTAIPSGFSPLVSGNRVLVPGETLGCLDIENGKLLWEIYLKADFMPTLDGEIAYIIASEQEDASEPFPGIYVVQIQNGEFRKIEPEILCEFGGFVTVSDNTLCLPYSSGAESGILALNSQTGEIIWKRTESPVRLCHQKIILHDEGILYLVDRSAELLALNRETGELLWAFGENLFLLGSLSADDSHIYCYSKSTGTIFCLDKKTGNLVWQSDSIFPDESKKAIIDEKSLISSKNLIFVCQHRCQDRKWYDFSESYIYALDNNTGTLVWTSRPFSSPPGPLAICGDFLIASSGSKIFVFEGSGENLRRGIEKSFVCFGAGITVFVVIIILLRKKYEK